MLQPKQELSQEKEEKILQELKELKDHCKLVKCLAFGRDVSIEVSSSCPSFLLLLSAFHNVHAMLSLDIGVTCRDVTRASSMPTSLIYLTRRP